MTPATATQSSEPRRGLLHLYVGRGKGKTSAAVGLIVRAAGRGLRCALVQFLKREDSTGEHFALKQLLPPVAIRCFGLPPGPGGGPTWVHPDHPPEEAFALARDALAALTECAGSGRFDVVVGDEMLDAVGFRLLPLEDLVAAVEARSPATELVLTGRKAPPALVELADLVTDMRNVKHPYDSGIKAREGIEF